MPKQAARLVSSRKKEVKDLMSLLVYAKTETEYDDARATPLESLSGNAEHSFCNTFMENWDNSQNEWVEFHRGNVWHLMNYTNSRIESKLGKIKDVVKGSFSIDELVATLLTLQEYAEEQYIAEYHRVGGLPSGLDHATELASLAMQISSFAFKLHHLLATGPNTDYTVQLLAPGKGIRSRCKYIFMETCLLPCRHLMHARSKLGFEAVVLPMKAIPDRWIVHSSVSDIGVGDVGDGGLLQVACPPLRKEKAVSTTDKHIQVKTVADKIVDRMVLQSTPTFSVGPQGLKISTLPSQVETS
ncbi:LOW QUALITY PROTEIN: hypothetical protein PHMEG_00012156 [Phytophthora megakarya]|uniref:SWIM-type domain-containing protein n=1 Tax=Phytophthora megakarya TaxID=4795 RepID=A0A225W9W0_9STRA|nr:LOW QUALITY PROTEIN: hypothetical protein PHMEG_00012156 [Phytophthora megakarya]